MNGFDVQAVGWLVTRDMLCHAAGALVGLKPPGTRRADDEIFRQWQRLIDAVDHDLAGQELTARILAPRRTPLSTRSEGAMRAFLERLVASYPERYGAQRLRSRCAIGAALTGASFLCCLILGHYASPDIPTLGQAALAFLLVGAWYLSTTVQLSRTYRLIRVLTDAMLPSQTREPRPASNADGPASQASEFRRPHHQIDRRDELGKR